jgi:hypothetical protein
MTLAQLKIEAKRLIADFPHLEREVSEFYHLAQDEIEQGESEQHECNLAYNDMMSLLTEENDI